MPFRGIVKRVNKKLRHGYITYHDIDYEIYVRFCDIISDDESEKYLQKGDRVQFTLNPCTDGSATAEKVKLLKRAQNFKKKV